jgi:uncharacterized membrane protein YczE
MWAFYVFDYVVNYESIVLDFRLCVSKVSMLQRPVELCAILILLILGIVIVHHWKMLREPRILHIPCLYPSRCIFYCQDVRCR